MTRYSALPTLSFNLWKESWTKWWNYFLKYVAFDTQSAEDAGTVPSTEKQFALAKLLSEQLKNIGVKDVSMSEHGYVYGTIPANGDYNCQTVGFLAHMDTSPDCPDENVRPQLVKHYDGKDITLNIHLTFWRTGNGHRSHAGNTSQWIYYIIIQYLI